MRRASIHLVFVKSLKLLLVVVGLISCAVLEVFLVITDTIIGRWSVALFSIFLAWVLCSSPMVTYAWSRALVISWFSGFRRSAM